MHRGFTIEVHDLIEHRRIFFGCAEDLYDLLVFIGTPSRSVINHVFRREHMQEPVASTSTSWLSLIAGRYVGKGDPIMIVRCQSDLPAAGEVLEPFARPHLVAGGCAASWPSMTRSASSSPRVSSMTSMQRVARSRTWITPQRHHGSARPAPGAAAGRCVSGSANDALRPPRAAGLAWCVGGWLARAEKFDKRLLLAGAVWAAELRAAFGTCFLVRGSIASSSRPASGTLDTSCQADYRLDIGGEERTVDSLYWDVPRRNG